MSVQGLYKKLSKLEGKASHSTLNLVNSTVIRNKNTFTYIIFSTVFAL